MRGLLASTVGGMAPVTSVTPFAGIVIDLVSGVAGAVIVLTGLLAGAFRALAILGESSPERVEWLTAVGFVAGMAIAGILLVMDLAVR